MVVSGQLGAEQSQRRLVLQEQREPGALPFRMDETDPGRRLRLQRPDQSVPHRVGFDYAMLIDPSNTSELRENLRISEIMYNPVGGDNLEYIELINIGTATIDLTGARFTNGVTFAFGPTLLAANARIVVVK